MLTDNVAIMDAWQISDPNQAIFEKTMEIVILTQLLLYRQYGKGETP